jgi:riboflavin synthase
MFTGLVETLGTVLELRAAGAGRRLTLAVPAYAGQLTLGESVAINGTCLTVVASGPRTLPFSLPDTPTDPIYTGSFEVGPETLLRTNLGELKPGDRVNLERSLRVGDRMGGHYVQGHVDGVGRIDQRFPEGEWETVWFRCAPALAEQMVPKGSVAVDGVSLTVVHVEAERFSVALIPHTLTHTTLGFKAIGSAVNLETDILAKYVWKCLLHQQGPRAEEAGR